jgi:exodeoxyribonuclease V gamma subunit
MLDGLVPAIASDPVSDEALDGARRRLVVEHPLQAFSIEGFKADAEPRLRSFDAEYCDALKAKLAPSAISATWQPNPEMDDDDRVVEAELPFFVTPLAELDDEWRNVTLDDLTRFFRNPARELLVRRLRVVLAEGDEELADDEPFVADWPGRRAFAQRLLPAYLDGADAATIDALARAGTEYPQGRLGESSLAGELQQLAAFAHALQDDLVAPPLAPVEAVLEFDVDGRRWQLAGGFGDVRSSGLVRHRYDDARAGDYLAGWILHLFLNALGARDFARRTTWHSRDGRYVLRPIDDAHARLAELLALYGRGLRAPLHFFPKAAWEFMKHGEHRGRAIAKWSSGKFPERNEPAYRLALRGQDDPLDTEFEECARTLFEPLLACIEDPRLP